MAEYIMKYLVRKAGYRVAGDNDGPADFLIDSGAVTCEEVGNDIYPPAKRALAAHGIPFEEHHAHRITDDEASGYETIVIMDSSNRRILQGIISPENMKKVHKMMEYAGSGRDVSDPWYTGDFETTFRDLVTGCKALLGEIGQDRQKTL